MATNLSIEPEFFVTRPAFPSSDYGWRHEVGRPAAFNSFDQAGLELDAKPDRYNVIRMVRLHSVVARARLTPQSRASHGERNWHSSVTHHDAKLGRRPVTA
jgi:hypothetical protein